MRVQLNPNGEELAGSVRKGTAHMTRAQLEEAFGPVHRDGDGEKVSFYYFFETPTGRATIRDYFANDPDEQSICAADQQTADHLIDFLTELGFNADDLPNGLDSRYRPADPPTDRPTARSDLLYTLECRHCGDKFLEGEGWNDNCCLACGEGAAMK